MKKSIIELYNGKPFCDCPDKCGKCPIVEMNLDSGEVKIYDPEKPESGSFVMSIAEYNALLANAQPANI